MRPGRYLANPADRSLETVNAASPAAHPFRLLPLSRETKGPEDFILGLKQLRRVSPGPIFLDNRLAVLLLPSV